MINDYIISNHDTENVIIIGDFNDLIIESSNANNVFSPFISLPNQYIFADQNIAESTTVSEWSYPSSSYPPSHLDHIILSNELLFCNTCCFERTSLFLSLITSLLLSIVSILDFIFT